jgi:phosphotransferase system HPr (HPr) family protein
MQTIEVSLVNPLGLHMRAAAKIVKLTAEFESSVFIIRPSRDRRADARSILSILELGAKQGSRLVIEASGDDESAAISAFHDLIVGGFGEL